MRIGDVLSLAGVAGTMKASVSAMSVASERKRNIPAVIFVIFAADRSGKKVGASFPFDQLVPLAKESSYHASRLGALLHVCAVELRL